MMHDLGLFVILALWILQSIYRFFQWLAKRTQQTMAQQRNAVQPAAMLPQQTVLRPVAMPPREPVRTIDRPRGDDIPVVAQEATREGFVRREEAGTRAEPSGPIKASVSQSSDALPGSVPTLGSLFRSSDDLLRAFILQEALAPPRSLRISSRKPPQE